LQLLQPLLKGLQLLLVRGTVGRARMLLLRLLQAVQGHLLLPVSRLGQVASCRRKAAAAGSGQERQQSRGRPKVLLMLVSLKVEGPVSSSMSSSRSQLSA
jgi:hypothetical protein